MLWLLKVGIIPNADGIGNPWLESIIVMDYSFSSCGNRDWSFLKDPTISLCDLLRLKSFTVGDFCLFPISYMQLMSCHTDLFLHIDINENVVCRIGLVSLYISRLDYDCTI